MLPENMILQRVPSSYYENRWLRRWACKLCGVTGFYTPDWYCKDEHIIKLAEKHNRKYHAA